MMGRRRQLGQSMTEFVVSASFALVPLFIIVPTVGKYIDMKLASTQAARYVTWEYTAHYSDLNDQPAGFKAISQAEMPLKPLVTVQREAERRFFSDTAIAISTSVDKAGYNVTDRNPLWTYHNGLPMFVPPGNSTTNASGSNKTPDKTYVFGAVTGIIGAGLNLISGAFNLLGVDAGFDAMNPDGNFSIDGRYDVSVAMPVEPAPGYLTLNSGTRNPLFGNPLNLSMTAKGKLLTETWGAGGQEHTLYQAKGLVPTILIDTILNGWGIPIQDIASTVLLSPELADDSLKFGHMTKDDVPVGALKNDSRTIQCDGGYCVD